MELRISGLEPKVGMSIGSQAERASGKGVQLLQLLFVAESCCIAGVNLIFRV